MCVHYCLYVCSIFPCVHYFTCTCNIEARRAFVPLQPLQPFSSLQPFRSLLPRHALAFGFLHLHTFTGVSVYLLPFLLLKRLQRSFYAVFKRFLSGLFVHAYLCTVSPVSGACRALFEANLPFLGEYRGAPPPKPKRREAQLSPHRILKFLKKFFLKNLLPLIPCLLKFFFLENPLSPSASCLSFQCQNPSFVVPFLAYVPTRPPKEPEFAQRNAILATFFPKTSN